MLKKHAEGFTLIELMIVVAIIGILAAISLPIFANLVAKTQESTTKANLGTLRSALAIYYGDLEGYYPVVNLGVALVAGNKYLSSIPLATLPKTSNSTGHASTAFLVDYDISIDGGTMIGYIPNTEAVSLGGWIYDKSGSNSPTWGMILVDCSHQDIKAQQWYTY